MTKGIYPRRGFGYSVFCTDAPSRQCGGVALFWRDCDGCAVEEQRRWGPNVLSFQLVTGRGRYYCIGAYRPPSEVDNTTAEDINRAWDKCPKGSEPILMGDLNVNLARPQSKWDIAMAEQTAAMDVHDMTLGFRQRRRKWVQGRWSWRMRRRKRWISSRPDYFLTREKTRLRLSNCALRMSNHHNSDHRATVATFDGGSSKWLRKYLRRRRRFPIHLAPGPRTDLEAAFQALKQQTNTQTVRGQRNNE